MTPSPPPAQTTGMETDNDPSQLVREVVAPRCEKCGRRYKAGTKCKNCHKPGKDILVNGGL